LENYIVYKAQKKEGIGIEMKRGIGILITAGTIKAA
jgi:hypothetical protein